MTLGKRFIIIVSIAICGVTPGLIFFGTRDAGKAVQARCSSPFKADSIHQSEKIELLRLVELVGRRIECIDYKPVKSR